ncbi:MAG TPA: HIT family protein [Gemmatimonadaceae bacterium]
MSSHCTFCDLIHGAAEVSVCYEDADAIAFMDIQPVNTGHVLVVPRQHLESLFDVPPELGAHLFGVTMRVANAVRRVTGCEDMNIVVNSGQAAGQDVFHYHVHIIPRRPGDGFDIQLPFPESQMPQREVLDMAAARIIGALNDPMRGEGEGSGSAEGQGSGRGRSAPASAGAAASASTGTAASASGAEAATTAETRTARGATERAVPIAVQAEGLADVAPSPAGSRRPAGAPALDAGADAREGAHGELVLEV